ncbi:MAG TPA: chemotaxis protein CheW [Spirochaetota bacterium]|nr:chemotaxis protein CheW [Spirochaetota bacterium]
MKNEKIVPQTQLDEQSAEETEQFVTFMIGNERYGVDILKVRDIIDMVEITQVPRSPACLKGVINLRGKIVPVVDLRLKFRMPEIPYTGVTVIIVVEVRSKLIGMIVDSVSDVVDVAVSTIDHGSYFRTGIRDEFVSGVGRHDEGLIIILDVEKILQPEDRCSQEKS